MFESLNTIWMVIKTYGSIEWCEKCGSDGETLKFTDPLILWLQPCFAHQSHCRPSIVHWLKARFGRTVCANRPLVCTFCAIPTQIQLAFKQSFGSKTKKAEQRVSGKASERQLELEDNWMTAFAFRWPQLRRLTRIYVLISTQVSSYAKHILFGPKTTTNSTTKWDIF